jgi:hypothetical protein
MEKFLNEELDEILQLLLMQNGIIDQLFEFLLFEIMIKND